MHEVCPALVAKIMICKRFSLFLALFSLPYCKITLRNHCYDRFSAILTVFTYDRFRRNLARLRSLALLSVPIVKIYKNLKIQDGGGLRLVKSKNHHISDAV